MMISNNDHKYPYNIIYRHWIKASLSLTIIMGIGWIGNVLFFSKELIFIAYIMTVFIAGQGIIIFILYVPLSSHVRKHINIHVTTVSVTTLSPRSCMFIILFTTHAYMYMYTVGKGSIWEMVEEETSQLFSAQQNNVPNIK